MIKNIILVISIVLNLFLGGLSALLIYSDEFLAYESSLNQIAIEKNKREEASRGH